MSNNNGPNKPFNDVVDHFQKVEGMPTKPARMNHLPLPIRIIGYFFIGCFILTFGLIVISKIFM
ncbi:hypothetical protein [Filobacillus milosensis]|uniref:hypothetical protein n=1 Tax=Filobacillus milosensis TaxID=94137 RepID=UPI001E603021|nr:hypothetical protein [Filobacillus milosensis]